MRTIVLGEPPVELEKLIEHRRAIGADLYDEVWEGDYHMAPAPRSRHALLQHRFAALIEPLADRAGLHGSGPFNIGQPDNYRVPDGGARRDDADVFVESAALVIEILSPDDETWDKLPFYADRGVDEVVVVDPVNRSVVWMERHGDGYGPVDRSAVLDVDVADLVDRIEWPPVADGAS